MNKATGEDKVQSAVFAPTISETDTRCASKREPQSELQLAHCALADVICPKVEEPTVAPFPTGELRLTMLKTL
jgi:hypothetical protein